MLDDLSFTLLRLDILKGLLLANGLVGSYKLLLALAAETLEPERSLLGG